MAPDLPLPRPLRGHRAARPRTARSSHPQDGHDPPVEVRHLRPTDLVSLAGFEARAHPNEARTRDRLDRDHRRPMSIATVLEQLIAAEDRQTLLAMGSTGIQGLLSARHRAGRTAWEVDWLTLDQTSDAAWTATALLERLGEEAVKAGVLRIFLRVPRDSSLLSAAQRAGFVSYVEEVLYRRETAETPSTDPVPLEGLRPRLREDEQAIFRLYHSAVPAEVRGVEGMTLEEWGATQDVHFGQQREYVWAHEDRLRAWLQATRGHGCGQLRFLVHPDGEPALPDLVQFGLAALRRQEPVLALVPQFQVRLHTVLRQDCGFEDVAYYRCLVRLMAVQVREAGLVPARAL